MPVPTPRTALELGRATNERLEIVEGRSGTPGRLNNMGRGPTTERDYYYPVPTTDAQRVALANRRPIWFNTDKGWWEGYYATTGLAGLTARGLISSVASGWFPMAGSPLTATRIQQNGFQFVGAGGIYGTTFQSGFLVNIGGFAAPAANQIEVPCAGLYDIVGCVYFSGGGAGPYQSVLIQDGAAGIPFLDTISARAARGAADNQVVASGLGIPLDTGRRVALGAQSSVDNNIYGNGINRHTFLSLSYRGPNLVNG